MPNTVKDGAISAYKEKTWGKNEGGENITNGYCFRGKGSFGKVVEGLKTTLKRGESKDVDGTEIKVLDARKNGVELEIEVEILNKGNRGVAVIKLYGPNKKKESVVMVTKSKESDAKYVTILAEQVIKPLMSRILIGESQDDYKNDEAANPVSCQEKEDNLLQCPHCDKTSHSSSGLKGHITKMHNEEKKSRDIEKDKTNKQSDSSNVDNVEMLSKDLLNEEANKVVNSLSDEIIVINEDKDSRTTTLEEDCLVIDQNVNQ